jgi:hypothetical protein
MENRSEIFTAATRHAIADELTKALRDQQRGIKHLQPRGTGASKGCRGQYGSHPKPRCYQTSNYSGELVVSD